MALGRSMDLSSKDRTTLLALLSGLGGQPAMWLGVEGREARLLPLLGATVRGAAQGVQSGSGGRKTHPKGPNRNVRLSSITLEEDLSELDQPRYADRRRRRDCVYRQSDSTLR
jgi:hypothetical protein